MDEQVPDATVLCRFRNTLSKQNAFEKILTRINEKMEQGGLMVNKGIIVDASVTVTQRKPRGKKVYEVAEDRKENEAVTVKEQQQSHVDIIGNLTKDEQEHISDIKPRLRIRKSITS